MEMKVGLVGVFNSHDNMLFISSSHRAADGPLTTLPVYALSDMMVHQCDSTCQANNDSMSLRI